MIQPPPRTYRVAQWATGNIGRRSLRSIIEHPDLELVGVYVYSAAKAGRDAGELCGLGPTGITATQQIEDIVALRPDCVVYMGDRADIDALCRLLETGIDVVTTRGEFQRPASMDPTVRDRVEAACRAGRATLHSTGSSPGFVTEALPLVLTTLERRLDRLTIDEFADLSTRDSPELLFGLMGFGQPPDTFDPGRWAHGASSFGPSLSALADALSIPLDRVEATGEVAVARHETGIAAGTIKAGTVAAQRMIVTGFRAGKPLLRFRANWYCSTDLEPAWDLRETGWRVVVEGDVPLDVSLSFPVPADRVAETTPGYTAHPAVNAIPSVCEAEPGIRTITEIPPVIARLGSSPGPRS